VAGIVAALKPDHRIGVFGQKIHDFSLALIAPLRSDNNDI